MLSLSEVNSGDEQHAAKLLEPLIERAPDIAARVAGQRPFNTTDDVRDAIRRELFSLDEEERIELFKAHPELAPDNPLAMTGASQSEQARLNLTSDTNKHRNRLADLNAQYHSRFGFPFITALARHENMQSVLTEFEARLAANRATEIKLAINQVAIISSERVRTAFGREDMAASRDAENG